MNLQPTLIDMLETFSVKQIGDWLLSGLVKYHDEQSNDTYLRAETAFQNADLFFGRKGDHFSATNELEALLNVASDIFKTKFDEALATVIDELAVTDTHRFEILRNLIELGLNTKSSKATRSIAGKILPDSRLCREICLEAIDFLSEGHSTPAMLELGKAIVQTDFPFEISAKLLVGLCKLDRESAWLYCRLIERKLSRQLETLEKYPLSLAVFKKDFSSCVLLANESSQLIKKILGNNVFASLLDESIKGSLTDSDLEEYVAITPREPSEISRIWSIPIFELCSVAFKYLFNKNANIKAKDTLANIDAVLAC